MRERVRERERETDRERDRETDRESTSTPLTKCYRYEINVTRSPLASATDLAVTIAPAAYYTGGYLAPRGILYRRYLPIITNGSCGANEPACPTEIQPGYRLTPAHNNLLITDYRYFLEMCIFKSKQTDLPASRNSPVARSAQI